MKLPFLKSPEQRVIAHVEGLPVYPSADVAWTESDLHGLHRERLGSTALRRTSLAVYNDDNTLDLAGVLGKIDEELEVAARIWDARVVGHEFGLAKLPPILDKYTPELVIAGHEPRLPSGYGLVSAVEVLHPTADTKKQMDRWSREISYKTISYTDTLRPGSYGWSDEGSDQFVVNDLGRRRGSEVVLADIDPQLKRIFRPDEYVR